MKEKYWKVLNEAEDVFDRSIKLDNEYTLQIHFEPGLRCSFGITWEDDGIYWYQFDDSIKSILNGVQKYYELNTTQKYLIPKIDEIKEKLNEIYVPDTFPTETFLRYLQRFFEIIKENYDYIS